jgi:hypothetical protein
MSVNKKLLTEIQKETEGDYEYLMSRKRQLEDELAEERKRNASLVSDWHANSSKINELKTKVAKEKEKRKKSKRKSKKKYRKLERQMKLQILDLKLKLCDELLSNDKKIIKLSKYRG